MNFCEIASIGTRLRRSRRIPPEPYATRLKGPDRNRLGFSRYSAASSDGYDRAASIGHQRSRHSIRTARPAASPPEPAVLESTGEAPGTEVTAAEVPATHGAAEVSAAKTSAEMASTHAPAAMAAASACNSVGGDSGTSQCHGNNGDRDSAQHGLPYGSFYSR